MELRENDKGCLLLRRPAPSGRPAQPFTPPSTRAPAKILLLAAKLPTTMSPRNGRRILDSLMELIHGTILLKDIPMMNVVLYRERFYSVSNRRLCLYRLCQHLGLITEDVPTRVELLGEATPAFPAYVFITNENVT